jgi:hypothetical protein
MEELKIPAVDRKLALELLRKQSQQALTSEGLSERAFPKCSVAQGASESPKLFSWFIEPLLRELQLTHKKHGYSIDDCTIVAQAFADDIVLGAKDAASLHEMLKTCGECAQSLGWTLVQLRPGQERHIQHGQLLGRAIPCPRLRRLH